MAGGKSALLPFPKQADAVWKNAARFVAVCDLLLSSLKLKQKPSRREPGGFWRFSVYFFIS
jgi:hypothetical protein